MFNFLLISFIIFIIISILFLISFYLFIKESKQKIQICKSNKDCNNDEICTLDIDYQNRCFKKNDIFHIFYTKLLVND
jgi:hypothetical protein